MGKVFRALAGGGMTVLAVQAGNLVYESQFLIEQCQQYAYGGTQAEEGEGVFPPPSYEAVPSGASYICSADNPNCDADTALASYYSSGNMIPVSIQNMSQYLLDSVVATEHRGFWYENTIDGIEVVRNIGERAIISSLEARQIQAGGGASTIEMQLIRNYAPDSMPDSELCRKVAEITLAQELLDQYAGEPEYKNGVARYPGKAIILQNYLNMIYLGRGSYGVEAAAQTYFGVSASEVTLAQAAYIAGLGKSPSAWDGDDDPAKNDQQIANGLVRRNAVLDNLVEAGMYSREVVEQAKLEPMNFLPYSVRNQGLTEDISRAAALGAEHFVVDVKQYVLNTLGISEEQFRSMGLRINTTLSENVQRSVFNAVNGVGMPQDGRQAASVVLGPDGKILGMYGGDYDNSQVNLAYQDGPVGSSLKIYVYARAREVGMITSRDQTFVIEPTFVWPNNEPDADQYEVSEGSHCPNLNACTIVDGIAYSDNQLVLQTLRDMEVGGLNGLEGTAEMMRQYGMDSESGAYPSMALGWWEVSTLDLAEGVNGLVANQGVAQDAHSIESVTQNQAGSWVPVFEELSIIASPHRVNSAEVAADITEGMRGVVRRGTASNVLSGIGTDTACKTGSVPGNAGAYITCTFATEAGNITIAIGMRHVEGSVDMGSGTTGGNWPARIFSAIANTMIDGNRSIN